MKVVIAPDSFKESLAAYKVCDAIASGVRRVARDAEIVSVPMADGGQGTVESLVRATNGQFLTASVTGPLGESLTARYGILGDGETAVLEMAAASGLELVKPANRNPLVTTTFGTGELILAAAKQNVRKIILGIGGSATNDGGAGMAQALGFRLLDRNDQPIGRGGGELANLYRIDTELANDSLADIEIHVACDVTNPLTGPQGASAVYGPQKGASPAMVEQLDANLRHFATVIQRDLKVDIDQVPGAGAAGGLGGGLMAFCGAKLKRGIEIVLEAARLRDKLVGADLCITGEGALDFQSKFGKTAVGVAQLAHSLNVPVIVLAGAILPGANDVLEKGVTAYFDITQRPCLLADAMAATESSLADVAEQVMRLYRIAK